MNYFDPESTLDESTKQTGSNRLPVDIHRWRSEIDSFVNEIAEELNDVAQLLNESSDFDVLPSVVQSRKTEQQLDFSAAKTENNVASNTKNSAADTSEFDQSETGFDEGGTDEQFNDEPFDDVISSQNEDTGQDLPVESEVFNSNDAPQPVESTQIEVTSNEKSSSENAIVPEESAESRLASLRERLSKLRVND